MSARPERFIGVALVGYRATGKSTVGRLLADRLGFRFVDADRALEQRFGRTVAEVFRERGEPVFREWEHAVLADLTVSLPAHPTVLATGGGVVVRPDNRALLRCWGTVAWLRADPAVLAARLTSSPRALADRPALTTAGTLAEVADVLAAREPFYREVADAVVETEKRTPDEVVRALLDVIPFATLGR